MSFTYNTLTTDGANLLAQATAANPIVLVDCLCSQIAANSNQELQNLPLSVYTLGTGIIYSASATNNVCRIVMRFNTADFMLQIVNTTYLKSVCVRARLQSQTDEDAIILCAISDPNSQIQIPDMSSPPLILYLHANVAIQAQYVIETVAGDCASIADLERFVSCHKAGDSSTGDNQAIKGNKIFDDKVIFQDKATFNDDIKSSASIVVTGVGFIECPTMYCDRLLPYPDGENKIIGDKANKFNTVYTSDVYTGEITLPNEILSLTPDGGGCDITFDVQHTGGYNTCAIKATSEDGNESGFIRFSFGGGDTDIEFKAETLKPSITETASLGTSGKKWYSLYSSRVYTSGLYGVNPSLNNGTLSLPIGGIICAYNSSWDSTCIAGKIITVAANTTHTRGLDGSVYTQNAIPAGNYVFLSHGYTGTQASPAMLQRIF